MADYKMVDIDQLETDLGTIADAIREKSGGTDALAFPEGFAEEIAGISTGPREAEITITATSSNKKLEYWYIDDGVLKAMTIPYNTPTVVRRSFGETFTLMRYKTGYTEDAVKPKITISGALYSERMITGSSTVSFFGYSFYVITPKNTTVTISIT